MSSNMVPFLLLHSVTTQARMSAEINSLRSSLNRSRYSGSSSLYHSVVKRDVLDYLSDPKEALDNDAIRQCINAVNQDEEMQAVYAQFVENVKKVKADEEQRVQNKFLDSCPKFENAIQQLEIIEAEINSIGFDIETKSTDKRYIKRADNEVGFAFDTRPEFKKFNGKELTKEDVFAEPNVFQKELDDFLKEYPNMSERLELFKKELAELTTNSFLLKINRKKRERREELESFIDRAEYLIEKEKRLRKNAEFYANLTEEQKQSIFNYFEIKDLFNQMCDRAEKLKEHAVFLLGDKIKGKEEDYHYLIAKRMESARSALTEEQRAKIDEFCNNMAKTIAESSKEELREMSKLDKSTVDKSRESMDVYKDLCVQIKESYLAQRKEQEDARTI